MTQYEVKKWKFYFGDGKVGTMRSWAVWNKEAVKEYNSKVGYKHILKVEEVKPKNTFAKGVQKRFSNGKKVSDKLRKDIKW